VRVGDGDEMRVAHPGLRARSRRCGRPASTRAASRRRALACRPVGATGTGELECTVRTDASLHDRSRSWGGATERAPLRADEGCASATTTVA